MQCVFNTLLSRTWDVHWAPRFHHLTPLKPRKERRRMALQPKFNAYTLPVSRDLSYGHPFTLLETDPEFNRELRFYERLFIFGGAILLVVFVLSAETLIDHAFKAL